MPFIRRLESSDAAAFQSLRLQGLADTPSAFGSSYDEEKDQPLSVTAQRLAPQPERCVFGAFGAGTLVGAVGILREGAVKRAHKATVWGLYVQPDARGRGVARALLAEALSMARGMPGLRQVVLSVNAGNTGAVALYRALGFEDHGLEPEALRIDGESHDELLMHLALLPRR